MRGIVDSQLLPFYKDSLPAGSQIKSFQNYIFLPDTSHDTKDNTVFTPY